MAPATFKGEPRRRVGEREETCLRSRSSDRSDDRKRHGREVCRGDDAQKGSSDKGKTRRAGDPFGSAGEGCPRIRRSSSETSGEPRQDTQGVGGRVGRGTSQVAVIEETSRGRGKVPLQMCKILRQSGFQKFTGCGPKSPGSKASAHRAVRDSVEAAHSVRAKAEKHRAWVMESIPTEEQSLRGCSGCRRCGGNLFIGIGDCQRSRPECAQWRPASHWRATW